MDELKNKIREIPDWPKLGVNFKDITTLIGDAEAFKKTIDAIAAPLAGKVSKVVAIDARGFILAAPVAYKIGVGFVPVRKKNKLPAETIEAEYEKEYGSDTVVMHKDAILAGEKVALVDDLIATGGTALAACELIEKLGGKIIEIVCLIDLPFLGGSKKLEQKGYKVKALVSYDKE